MDAREVIAKADRGEGLTVEKLKSIRLTLNPKSTCTASTER